MVNFVYENFYLNMNAQSNGDHEVHRQSCKYYLPYRIGNNFKLIGLFSNEIDAVNRAKRLNPGIAHKIDGCAICCPRAHRR